MSFFSKVWGVVKKVAPVVIGAALAAPTGGLSLAAGAALGGAAGSALRGGNLSQIIQGAGYGYGAGTGLSALSAAGAVPAAGTVGPQSTGILGGIKNLASGVPGSFTAAGNAISPSLTSSINNAGTSAGNFLAHPIDGIASVASKGYNALSNILSGTGGGSTASAPSAGTLSGAGGGGSSFGGTGTLFNVLSGAYNLSTQNKAKDDLLKAQNRSLASNAPFLESGTAANNMLADRLGTSGNTGATGYGELTSRFNPTDLANDPGYKFQLEQGLQARDRANAAAGNLASGAALKEAEEYGTGLADKTYNDAFTRWMQNNSQIYNTLAGQTGTGMAAAGNQAIINDNTGNIKANAGVAKGNTLTGTLSGILSGAGAKTVIGYKPDGTPIYA